MSEDVKPKRGGNNSPRVPQSETEELVLYKNLFTLQVIAKRRKELAAQLSQMNAQISEMVQAVKPYASWEDLSTALDEPVHIVRSHYGKRE